MSISKKTLLDLEFHQVLEQVAGFAISDLGKAEILEITPITEHDARLKALDSVNEYFSSFENDNRIPNHSFYNISKAIHLLKIENAYIEPKDFLEIEANLQKINEVKFFFKKFKEIFPILHSQAIEIPFYKEIGTQITAKITKYAEVSDNATPLLKSIRREINRIQGQIGVSFTRALQKYQQSGYLDAIKESVVEGRRVLAVQYMYRKKISGSLLGASKTGSIAYIAPQATLKYSRELQQLALEEKDEIIRILKELTNELRPHRDLLILYQDYLTDLDIIASKAKYAQDIHGILPKIAIEKKIYLREAYHPILWKQNTLKGLPIIPQTINLDEKQQIIVISGPNAGGKSITLKTIGLLQVMLQCGILIPVHEKSELSFFDTILTDIGDNQSIENQLSTYSYRLKNMNIFLRKCNEDTLFLIDEFGTGSDPELGGALAEVLLEDFYNKKAFGVITTHYANLKALADELEFATNANMQFDKRSLEPLYELVTGQAGSSFTFEVAQQNHIPYSLINRAKKRVSRSKIRLDKTISKLQTERNKLQRQSHSLEKEKGKASETAQELLEKKDKVQDKLEQFQTLYDSNQKMLQYGRTVNEFVNIYFQTNNKKQLTTDFLKWVQAERVKHSKKNPPKKLTKKNKKTAQNKRQAEKKKLAHTEKEVLKAVEVVREKIKKETVAQVKKTANYQYKIGDIVRLIDGRAQGSIEKIEGKKILIDYGLFTTQTSLDKIELVKRGK